MTGTHDAYTRRSLARRCLTTALLALSVIAPASAQSLRDNKKPGEFAIYSQAQSRRVFKACDLNGDDQLSFLEAVRTLVLGESRAQFRGLDLNRNAVLSFDEFDAHFQQLTRLGQKLAIKDRAVQRLPLSFDTSKIRNPTLLRFFAKLDADNNDRISLQEWKRLGGSLGQELEPSFNKLDKDLSRSLSLTELSAFAKTFELLESRTTGTTLVRPLPEALRVSDRNGDGMLDRSELERALSRIHSSLLEHATRIFLRADRNADNRLDPIELRKAIGESLLRKSR